MTDPKQQLLDALDAASAVEGNDTFLTSEQIVERQVDVRTMMTVGSRSDYSAIEPYLKEPTESRIGEAFAEAEVA